MSERDELTAYAEGLRSALEERVWNEAVEECAKVAETSFSAGHPSFNETCAAAIRALSKTSAGSES